MKVANSLLVLASALIGIYIVIRSKKDTNQIEDQFQQVGEQVEEFVTGDSIVDRILQYRSYVEAAATEFEVPNWLIYGTIQRESGGVADSIGDSGQAWGLMQVHPAAAIDARSISPTVVRSLDPAENIRCGTAYLRWIWNYLSTRYPGFPSDSVEQWRLVAMAFNNGIGNVVNGSQVSAGYADYVIRNGSRIASYA